MRTTSTFFIADLHFGHKNILSYDNRPFNTVEENDRVLVERWNNTVGLEDDVWVLGDISWYPAAKTIEIFNKLNGTKHLCAGNHDKKLLRNKDVQNLFAEIVNYKELQLDDGTGIVLCHYPIPTYNNHYYGWYHLFGHVHTGFEYNMIQRFEYEMTELYGYKSKMFNVGCMTPEMDYYPRTLSDVIMRYRKT